MGILSTPKEADTQAWGLLNLYTMQKRKWTQYEEETLIRLYEDPKVFPKDIAKMLGRTLPQVYNKARKMGLNAPMERIRMAGKIGMQHPKSIATRFSKGHIPPNKGKKVSPKVYEKMSVTMFKKGHTPVNHREVGSERINVDGYIEIKVAEPNRWKLKHRIIWEQVNGEIPKGYNVQFKNHNPQDCRIENLYLICRIDQMRTENSLMAKYPKEMQEVIRLKGVVNRIIHKRERDHEQ